MKTLKSEGCIFGQVSKYKFKQVNIFFPFSTTSQLLLKLLICLLSNFQGGALIHFNTVYNPLKISPLLDAHAVKLKQQQQPVTKPSYDTDVLGELYDENLDYSTPHNPTTDPEVFGIFGMTGFDENGIVTFNELENVNKGWIFLTLSYWFKVLN